MVVLTRFPPATNTEAFHDVTLGLKELLLTSRVLLAERALLLERFDFLAAPGEELRPRLREGLVDDRLREGLTDLLLERERFLEILGATPSLAAGEALATFLTLAMSGFASKSTIREGLTRFAFILEKNLCTGSGWLTTAASG